MSRVAVPNKGWLSHVTENGGRIGSRPVLTPSADHPITIASNPERIVVKVGDTVVADTSEALNAREANYPAVQYIPRKDVKHEFFGSIKSMQAIARSRATPTTSICNHWETTVSTPCGPTRCRTRRSPLLPSTSPSIQIA